jgi:hypothetical protein
LAKRSGGKDIKRGRKNGGKDIKRGRKNGENVKEKEKGKKKGK